MILKKMKKKKKIAIKYKKLVKILNEWYLFRREMGEYNNDIHKNLGTTVLRGLN